MRALASSSRSISNPIKNSEFSELSSSIAKVAEEAAVACVPWIGQGNEKMADAAAVNAMRESLNSLNISGRVVIGEGERDEAPMLYIGEEVGKGGIAIDIALDPLEGTTICAHAKGGSLAVIAFAEKSCFLHAPDVYMEKIAVGPGLPEGIVDLDNSPKTNLRNLAKARGREVSELKVVVLRRERHEQLIAHIRETGAMVKLIDDGDVAWAIAACDPKAEVDAYMGIGGAPEGVLAAAAFKTMGGQMFGRLIFNNDERQIARARQMGITDLNKKYSVSEMAQGRVIFAAAGVTDGYLLAGVKTIKSKESKSEKLITSSIVMNSELRTVQRITTEKTKISD